MEMNEREIPRYVFEDLLFRRRLQRNIADELERFNQLLTAQIKLMENRKTLMSEIQEAVQQRWEAEHKAESSTSANQPDEEAQNG